MMTDAVMRMLTCALIASRCRDLGHLAPKLFRDDTMFFGTALASRAIARVLTKLESHSAR